MEALAACVPSSGQANQAELADVGRLARRLLNRAVEVARSEDQPLRWLLMDYLGPEAAFLPTVSATWPSYEHVNVQVGLDAWLAGAGPGGGPAGGREHEVYGITGIGFMRQMEIVGIGDFLQGSNHGPFGSARGGHLLGQLPEMTVIVISGRALGRIREACSVARTLQPAIVVVEDVDLIAKEGSLIKRTEGVTAAFLKELLRKAALLSCESDEAGEGPIRVTDAHLTAALDQLLDSRNQLTRVLLGGEQPASPGVTPRERDRLAKPAKPKA